MSYHLSEQTVVNRATLAIGATGNAGICVGRASFLASLPERTAINGQWAIWQTAMLELAKGVRLLGVSHSPQKVMHRRGDYLQ